MSIVKYKEFLTFFQPLLEALVTGLEAEPRVAANVCWAFTSLAEAAYEQAEVPDWQEGSTPATYKLSKYFPPIVERLLITTDRQDAATANLRSAAYEALMEMIKNSPKDCYEIVKTTIRIVTFPLIVCLFYFLICMVQVFLKSTCSIIKGAQL